MEEYRRGPTPDLVAAMPHGTEDKLRGMRCTADQRKNLMRAAKLGLGPLKQFGMSSSLDGPSRSRSPRRQPVLAIAGGSSSSRAAAPLAPGAGRSAVKAQADDSDEDLGSFLAGGKAMAQKAAQVAAAARERAGRHTEPQAPVAPRAAEPPPPQFAGRVARADAQAEATVAAPATATAERERLEAENREREKRRQEEEHRRLEEERHQEERRRARQEEKRKRKEDKAKRRAPSPQGDGSEDDEAAESSEDRDHSRPAKSQGGVFKKAFKADGSQRQHWGESVKGRVSNDYKGFTDADLDRRFGLPGQQSNEKLMTEEQVLAMLRSGRGPKG